MIDRGDAQRRFVPTGIIGQDGVVIIPDKVGKPSVAAARREVISPENSNAKFIIKPGLRRRPDLGFFSAEELTTRATINGILNSLWANPGYMRDMELSFRLKWQPAIRRAINGVLRAEITPGASMHEIGSGSGFFEEVLPDDYRSGYSASDPFADSLEALRVGLRRSTATKASAQDLPFKTGELDAVVSFDALPNITFGFDNAVGEVLRALKPGGKLIVFQYNPPHFGMMLYDYPQLAVMIGSPNKDMHTTPIYGFERRKIEAAINRSMIDGKTEIAHRLSALLRNPAGYLDSMLSKALYRDDEGAYQELINAIGTEPDIYAASPVYYARHRLGQALASQPVVVRQNGLISSQALISYSARDGYNRLSSHANGTKKGEYDPSIPPGKAIVEAEVSVLVAEKTA